MLLLVVRVRIGVATLTMLRDGVALLTTSTFLRGGRMIVGWTNDCDRTFAAGEVAGLNCETEWASGLMHRKACLELAVSKRCMMHRCRAAWYHLRHGNTLHVLLPALIDQLAVRENR